MNLMFKELSLSAGLACATIDGLPGSILVAVDKTGNRIDPNIALNIFADSIIEECIKQIEAAAKEAALTNRYMGDDVPSTVHIVNIRKKFGQIK